MRQKSRKGLFVGRRTELELISDHLNLHSSHHHHQHHHHHHQQQPPPPVVLGGIGGIGKTQLAIAYANHHALHKDNTSIFWLNAASTVTLDESLRIVANAIFGGQDIGNLQGKELLEGIHHWLSDTANTAWLLIFDNYDDPAAFDIKSYLPPASHGAIFITTRRPDLVTGQKFIIRPFENVEEGLEILHKRSGRADVEADTYAYRLAQRLGGLPLALTTAGLFLRKSHFTFKEYLEEYEKRWNPDPRGRSFGIPEYKLGLNDQDRTLYTTWRTSYIQLESEDEDAARLLRLCAYFDHQQLWYELFHAGLYRQPNIEFHEIFKDSRILDSVARTLVDYGFLELNEGLHSWSMHACVHDWTLAELNKDIITTHYWYAFDSVTTLIKQITWDTLGHLAHAQLAPHAAWLVSHRFCQDKVTSEVSLERCELAYRAGQFLREQSQHLAGEGMYQRALRGNEKARGPEHTSTLSTVNNLGTLYRHQGKMQEAEQMYLRALRGKEKAWGPEHTSTLTTVNNLGALYRHQGKMQEAEQMYLRALHGKEKAWGPEHTSTLSTVNNLGALYRHQGKIQEAEEMFQRTRR